MKKGQGTPENKKKAFGLYIELGGKNIKAMLGRLRDEHGIEVSAQTLINWATEGKWKEHIMSMGHAEFEKTMLLKLIRQIERLERRQEISPAPDMQSVYAYTNLINSALKIKRTIPEKIDPEEMCRRAKEIFENDFGIKR